MKFLLPVIASAFLFQSIVGPGVAMDRGDEKEDGIVPLVAAARPLGENAWVNTKGHRPIDIVEALWWGNPAERRPFPIEEAARELLHNRNHIDYLGMRKFGVVFAGDKVKVSIFNRENPGQDGYQIIDSLPAPEYSLLISGECSRALIILRLRDNILQTRHPIEEAREFDLGLPRMDFGGPNADFWVEIMERHLDANGGYIETLNGRRLSLSFSPNYVIAPGGPGLLQPYQVRLDQYRIHNDLKRDPREVIKEFTRDFNLFFDE